MWFRIILTAITILCTFSRVLHANQTTHAKDIICVLLMAGLNKEDLDEGARQTLMVHHVDIENMDMEEMRQKCYAENQLNKTTTSVAHIINSTESTKQPDTTLKKEANSNPILANSSANNVEPKASDLNTNFWILAKLGIFNALHNETTKINRDVTTERIKLKIENSTVIKTDYNKILNIQYMKDVWTMFSKQYLIETTTEVTKITTTTVNTPKTEQNKPIKRNLLEIKKLFEQYLSNIQNKEEIKKPKDVKTVTYEVFRHITEKNLQIVNENISNSNKVGENIQKQLSPDKLQPQEILKMINKLLINNMHIKQNLTKSELEEKIKIKEDNFSKSTNGNKVPEKQTETTTMIISSNVIQDIADKVKNIIIKDLINKSNVENTTVKTTSTTLKDDEQWLREFKQLFRDFKKEKMHDGKYEFTQKKKIVIESPNFTTSMSLSKNIHYPFDATNNSKAKTTKKSKGIPNIIQTNQLEIPPLFTLDPNPQGIRNIVVPSTTHRSKTNKNHRVKYANKPQKKVNKTPANYNDIKIDENYPKITEITHKVYGFQPHPTAIKNVENDINLGKPYNREIYSMPEMNKLNKMFNTINRGQMDKPRYTSNDKSFYDDTRLNLNEYSEPNNRRNKDQNRYYDRNQNTYHQSGPIIKTNERNYYYRNEPQNAERYSRIVNKDVIDNKGIDDNPNNFYNKPDLYPEIDRFKNNHNYYYEKNHPQNDDRISEVRNIAWNNNGYPVNIEKEFYHRNEPRNVYPEKENINIDRTSNNHYHYYGKTESDKMKVNTNHRIDGKRYKKLQYSEPITKRRLNNMRQKNLESIKPKNFERHYAKGNIFENNFKTSKEGVKEIMKTFDTAIDGYKRKNDRNIAPLRGDKNTKHGYDDTHFRDFLETQQKVNDILDKILNMKPSNGHITSVEII